MRLTADLTTRRRALQLAATAAARASEDFRRAPLSASFTSARYPAARPMARASLRSLEPTRWPGAVANLFLVASVGLLIYSDVGLSAQIMTNIEPEVISEIGYVACEPVPTRRLDEASGACGAADAAIWAATSLDVWINDVMTPWR